MSRLPITVSDSICTAQHRGPYNQHGQGDGRSTLVCALFSRHAEVVCVSESSSADQGPGVGGWRGEALIAELSWDTAGLTDEETCARSAVSL